MARAASVISRSGSSRLTGRAHRTPPLKALVVYYSRTGHTRALAQQIAAMMDAKLDEIIDRRDRSGILGFLRSGSDAWFSRRANIVASAVDPSTFDMVIIGTPVWRASLSSPVRAYLPHPDHLEQRLGTAQSKGCIRIPAKLNDFTDRHALLDEDYEQEVANDAHLWVLRADRTPTSGPAATW